MPNENAFTGDGCYQIKVLGHLQASWTRRMGAMAVRSDMSGNQAEITVLEGPVRDQAELAGILNTLYELHLPLLSVNRSEKSI
jgi:hypothetical protein